MTDYKAMLARAEQMVDTLRTRFVCEGWHEKGLNEEAADRMLQFFRHCADGLPENDQEFRAVLAFVGDYGQSLEWLLRGDPKGMICNAAAASARAAAL